MNPSTGPRTRLERAGPRSGSARSQTWRSGCRVPGHTPSVSTRGVGSADYPPVRGRFAAPLFLNGFVVLSKDSSPLKRRSCYQGRTQHSGYSRHQYAELVFDQKVETWVELHVRALESFGGVVKRVVLDNLKAGIVKAVVHDQEAQRSYRELAEHYGFLISPCRPYTPHHKGKVESGVRYVKRNALAGREFKDIHEANAHLTRWVRFSAMFYEVAVTRGKQARVHGTTQELPLVRFEREGEHLSPLPLNRYEVAVWKQVKLHPDCHVVFDYSFYSAPHRLVGEKLWLRATPRRVEVYYRFERLATHERAVHRGQRRTIGAHLPPDKLAGVLPEPTRLRALAAEVGASTAEFIDRLLGVHRRVHRPAPRGAAAGPAAQCARRVEAAASIRLTPP